MEARPGVRADGIVVAAAAEIDRAVGEEVSQAGGGVAALKWKRRQPVAALVVVLAPPVPAPHSLQAPASRLWLMTMMAPRLLSLYVAAPRRRCRSSWCFCHWWKLEAWR